MTVWQVASLQLLGFFAAARLVEVGASALRARLAWQERRGRVRPERWWPTMVALQLFVLGGSAAFVAVLGRIPPLPLLAVALGLLGAATLLRAWVYLVLGGRWNVRVIDPGTVCTTGPYRFVRHPSYLAVILEVAALPVAVGAYEIAAFASLANGLLLSLRIPFEEAALAEQHPEYRDVMMGRPRLLPRPRQRRRRPA